MSLKELIESRYSVRAYLPQIVEDEKIEYILECARLAPSACNLQPWKFYVITDGDIQQKVYKAYDRDWFRTAPVQIIICEDTFASWKRKNHDNKDHADIDAAIASEHICLAAAEIGLGTCWICNFDPQTLKEALDLPSHLQPVAIFPIGYIDEENSKATEKRRKPISDITEWI